MRIVLNETDYIDVDSRNYTLYTEKISTGNKTKGEKIVSLDGYFPTLKLAIKDYVRIKDSEKDVEMDVYNYMDSLSKKLDEVADSTQWEIVERKVRGGD